MEKICNRIIKYGLYLLVFLLPLWFLPFSFEFFEFNKQYLLFFFCSLLFFVWLFKMVVLEKELRFKRTPLDIPVLLFLVFSLLSTIFSVDKISSIFGFYGRFSDGFFGILSLGLLYFLITNNVEVKSQVPNPPPSLKLRRASKFQTNNLSFIIGHWSLLKAFLLSSALVVLVSYLSIFNVFGKIFGKTALIWQRTFNPVSGSLEGLAMFLVVIVALITPFFLCESKTNGGQTSVEQLLRRVLFFASLFLLLIIDFGPAWIILFLISGFLGLGFWLRIFPREKKKFFWLGILIIFATVGILTNIIRESFNLPKEVILDQKTSWDISFKSLKERPILGSGPGTFFHDFTKFKPKDFNQTQFWQIRFDRPASYIGEIVSTMGILGTFSYFLLIGLFFLISWFFLQATVSKSQISRLRPSGFGGQADLLDRAEREAPRRVTSQILKSKKKSIFFPEESLPLLTAFLALFLGQFFYYQNTVLSFTFWLVLSLFVVSWQGTVRERTFSLKKSPELSLIFNGLIMIFGLILIGAYFFAGKFYLADAYYAKAQGKTGLEKIKLVEKVADLNPYQPQYKTILAKLYLNEALSEMKKPEPKEADFSFYASQAITYAKEGVGLSQREGGLVKKSYVRGAVSLSPNQVMGWETLGMIYRDIQPIAAGSRDWGIKAFERALELEPKNPVLQTELGKLYFAANDIPKAKEKFIKAKELKSDYLEALIQLVLVTEKESGEKLAIEEMEALSQKFPFDVEVPFQLGRLYFNDDKTEEAISQFKKVLEAVPNHSNALYSLALAYKENGEKELAIETFEKVLELNPGNADVKEKLKELK